MRTTIVIALLYSVLCFSYAQNIEVVTEELCSPNKPDETFTWCMNGALNRIPYRLNYPWESDNITSPICEQSGPTAGRLYDDCYAVEKVAFGELEQANMPNNEIRTARLLFILTTNHQVIIKELNTESDIFRKTLKGTTDFHNDGMFSIQLGTQKVALIFSDFDTGTNIVWIVYSNWRYNEYIWTIPADQGCSPFIIGTTAFVIDVDTVDIVNSVKQCGKSYLYFSKKINGALNYYKRILIENDDPNSAVKLKHIAYEHSSGHIDYIVLHDASRVHILAHSDIEQVDSIDWMDPGRLTLFYMITENEEGEKITNLSPLVLPTQSGLNNFWLAIGYTNSRAINSLKIVLLADFNQLDPSRVRIGNPAGKAAPCANPNFYRTPDHRCQQRFSHVHSINIAHEAKIEAVIARNIKPVELNGSREVSPNLGLALYHDHMKSNTSYTAIFIAAGRRLWVLGLSEKQFESDYGGKIMFDEMITYLYIGKINSLAVSENGMHVFSSMSRSQYELLSMKRTEEVCSIVHNNGSDTLLYNMYWNYDIDVDCDRADHVTLNEFVQYASLCPPLGAYCYSFSSNVFRGVSPGYYTVNSYQELRCDRGSYCPGGLGMKLPCPAGYQCPTTGLISPLICPASSAKSRTCYTPGMVRPRNCTEGNVCITAYTTPIPAPPGYYTSSLYDRREYQNLFQECKLGEYCPLARSVNHNRLCPDSRYCIDPEVILPNDCPCEVELYPDNQVTGQHCSYCPGGQYAPDDCPAGYYCDSPVNKVICQPTTYCPNGTKIPVLCPAGFYCPRPDVKIECPAGSFCPLGSVTHIACSPFAACPAQTSEYQGFEVVIFAAIIAVVTAGAWFGAKKWRAYKRKKAAESREAVVKESSEKLTTLFKEKTFKVNIAFKELALLLNKGDKKKIISETTGVIRAGKLTAILGPSGAGKTAFLETLAGRAHYGEMQGDVFINGMACHIHHLKRLLGYVPPDDTIHHDMTVKEVLRFSADLRLPRTTSRAEKDQIVNSIIKLLRLTDVQDELIGNVSSRGISGGQRKRVNIGVELVADPTILFLDEPTSGLDSNNGMEVVKILKRISRVGLTVLAIIHQPRYDIFSMFDDVILFGRGGRILYMGPSKDVLPYFKDLGYECPTHQNPADFVLDVVCGEVKAKSKAPVDLLAAWKDEFEKEFDEKYKPFFPLPNEVIFENAGNENNRVSLNDGFIGDGESQEMTSYKLLGSSTEDINKPAVKYNKTKPPKRKAASFLRQIWLFGFRFLRQQIKDVFTLISDVLLVLISAIMFGLLFRHANYIGPPPESTCQSLINKDFVERCLYPLADPFPQMALLTGIGLALPAAVAAIRIFGPEKQIYFREASAGGSTVAYFIGKDLAFLPWTLAMPLLYCGIWGSFVPYRGDFGWYYAIYILIYWISVSIGEIGGIALKSKLTSVFTVAAIFIFAMFAGVLPSNREVEKLGIGEFYYGSFFRYSTEAFYVTEIRNWETIYNIQSGLTLNRFDIDNYLIDMIILACYGLALRIIACVLMVVLNRDKKR
jgi:ABC-type multidrug transport system ATPase subunit